MKNAKIFLMMLIALLLLGACGGDGETAVEPATSDTAQTTSTDENMADEAMEEDEMMDESMDDDMAMTEHEEGMAELEETMEEAEEMAEEMEDTAVAADGPVWKTTTLTDVRSGETFTLADFEGKTVFVETMATWCTNCRRQLLNVTQAKDQLGDTEDVVFVAISVETNISDAELLNYTEETGYFFTFAVATPEMVVSLADSFGQTITNPPSTPHFIIRPDGSTTELVTGFEGPDDIIENIQAES